MIRIETLGAYPGHETRYADLVRPYVNPLQAGERGTGSDLPRRRGRKRMVPRGISPGHTLAPESRCLSTFEREGLGPELSGDWPESSDWKLFEGTRFRADR